MRALLVVQSLWCLSGLLVLIVLLVIAAALLSRSRRREAHRLARVAAEREREVVATAPFEALQALGERLGEIQRHLPPHSDGAQWLADYRYELRTVMDRMYESLHLAADLERSARLAQLGREVAELERVVSQHLSATLSSSTDRSALDVQLEQLRKAV